MKHAHAEDLYKTFNDFIDTCIINNNSLLTDQKNVFTKENIEECIKRFVDNYKDDKRNYEEKIKEQFNGASKEVNTVFAHANWLWAVAVTDMNTEGKKRAVRICLGQDASLREDPNLFPNGFGSAGTFHKQNKYWEVVSNLKLFRWLKKYNLTDNGQIKTKIISICLFAKYDESSTLDEEIKKDFKEIKNTCAMYNILLHLCNPEKYERIASDNHKSNIITGFDSLIDLSSAKNNDEKIAEIRVKLIESKSVTKDFDFYDEAKVLQIWNPWLTDSEFNELQGLSFKKNIILFGPPGTGKTYNAKSFARSFIIQELIKKDKKRVKDYFESKINIDNRIKRLQLHSNYSYEDFIAGIRLKDGKTFAEKGFFLGLCEEISKDEDKIPYVLILDEINRIDLSRLFGEAFSAIENRTEPISLSVGGFSISVPENLYIIGTMNEIDFSLERIDFAMRRRFVWFKYGFKETKLKEIIYHKKGRLKVDDNDLNLFIDRAVRLNKKIDDLIELGRQYEIGHTFFSDIIDISHRFSGRQGYITKINLFKEAGPVQVLWDISIEPMIQAFLGNLDEKTKNEKIIEMRDLFLNGTK